MWGVDAILINPHFLALEMGVELEATEDFGTVSWSQIFVVSTGARPLEICYLPEMEFSYLNWEIGTFPYRHLNKFFSPAAP